MRGAGDRDLVVRQVVARAHERERLDGFDEERMKHVERRVAGGRDDLASAHGDGVNEVPRLDDSVPAHLDDDRLAHAARTIRALANGRDLPYVP